MGVCATVGSSLGLAGGILIIWIASVVFVRVRSRRMAYNETGDIEMDQYDDPPSPGLADDWFDRLARETDDTWTPPPFPLQYSSRQTIIATRPVPAPPKNEYEEPF